MAAPPTDPSTPASAGSLIATIVTDEAALSPHEAAWARLAAEAGRPYGHPGWALAWWRHMAPPGALLRVVLVFDGTALVGVAPYFAFRGRAGRSDYRLLCSGTAHRIDPLAPPGMEAAVGAAVARALAGARPRPSLVSFEALDAASPWPDAIARGWPGRLRPGRYRSTEALTPMLDLDAPDYATWLASKSQNFRQQMNQSRRRIEKLGARLRLVSDPTEAPKVARAFAELHDARWGERGGLLDREQVEAMLADAAGSLAGDGTLRLWCVEYEERFIAVQVFVAAGGRLAYWNGGWDESHSNLRPALVSILAAVEDAYARGERQIDFGGGEHPYKLRFTGPETTASVTWSGLFPVNARYPVTRAQMAPAQVEWRARAIVRAMPPERRERLKRLLRRSPRERT